jgi:hypothetical protein
MSSDSDAPGISQLKTKRAKRLVLSSDSDSENNTPLDTKLVSSPKIKKNDLVSSPPRIQTRAPDLQLKNDIAEESSSDEEDIMAVPRRLVKTGDLSKLGSPVAAPPKDVESSSSDDEDIMAQPRRLVKTGDISNPGSPKDATEEVSGDDIAASPSSNKRKQVRNPVPSKKARLDLERETQRLLRGKVNHTFLIYSSGQSSTDSTIWVQSD